MSRNLEMSIAITKRLKPAELEDLTCYLMKHHEKLFHEEVLLQMKKQDRELARLRPRLDPPQPSRKKKSRSRAKPNGQEERPEDWGETTDMSPPEDTSINNGE